MFFFAFSFVLLFQILKFSSSDFKAKLSYLYIVHNARFNSNDASCTAVDCSADARLEEHREAMAVLYNDGTVLWIPQSIFFSSCPIDITHFPFDIQTCTLEFGSWTYDGHQLDLQFFENKTEVRL